MFPGSSFSGARHRHPKELFPTRVQFPGDGHAVAFDAAVTSCLVRVRRQCLYPGRVSRTDINAAWNDMPCVFFQRRGPGTRNINKLRDARRYAYSRSNRWIDNSSRDSSWIYVRWT